MGSLATSTSADPRWTGLYRSGAIAASLIAVLLVGEIVVYVGLPRASTPLAHFELFADDPLAGLLTLDLLGLVSYLLFIPVMLALYVALHPAGEAVMASATVLFFLGVADFLATNTVFPVLFLSQQYAEATTDAERGTILAAGQAMFTLFNENAFLVSYVLVSAAWAMIGGVMLRSSRFGRASGYAGVLAGTSGIIAVVLEHVSDALVPPAIGLYFAAILFLLLWVVLICRKLFRITSPGAAS